MPPVLWQPRAGLFHEAQLRRREALPARCRPRFSSEAGYIGASEFFDKP